MEQTAKAMADKERRMDEAVKPLDTLYPRTTCNSMVLLVISSGIVLSRILSQG